MKLCKMFAGALALALFVAPAAAQVTPGTSPLAIGAGGTGASSAAAARSNLGLGTMAPQNANGVVITGGTITGMPNPTGGSDVANKTYVDSIASGISIQPPSALATASVLPNSPTYSNGASGVGATLTAGSNTTLTVDGTAAPLSTVVLVKNQASAFQNGIYTVTQAGSGAAPWILTRATYFDQAAEMKAGSYTFISAGATNVGSSFTLQTAVTTVGTDALNWLLFTQGNANAVTGGGASTVGNIPVISNTTTTGITDSGFSPSQIPGMVPSTATVTISNASPGVVTWNSHNLLANATIYFCTTGGLPTGLTPCVPANCPQCSPNTYKSNPTLYYVVGSSITANTFTVATSIANAKAGIAVNTSSAGSGTHTAFANAMACAGCVGEMIWNVVEFASPVALATPNVPVTWNSLPLTAGVWEVWGNSGVTGTGGTTFDNWHATIGHNISGGFLTITSPYGGIQAARITTNFQNGIVFPHTPQQFVLTGSTTINAGASAGFTGGTASVYGALYARRR